MKTASLRIAFDHQIFVGQSYGGISRYFTRLARELREMGQEVGIFAPFHRNDYLSTLPRGIVKGRYLNRYPPKIGRLLAAYNSFMARAGISRWKPSLVHETYYSKIRSAPPGCPTVITVYDMIHELFPEAFHASGDDTAAAKRIAIERADHVICISENTKSDLMRIYGTPENRISVVHLGFDQFAPGKGTRAPDMVFPRPFLLYVGERMFYKNFAGFLMAVASSPRLSSDFDVVAFGGRTFSAKELGLMSSLGFPDGQVRHAKGGDALLGGFYEAAGAFIYPSLYEGFGIPPLEAMAHGCPVVSSSASSMPEVIGNAAEFFVPTDIDDMRRAIESVVYSESRTHELRAAGAERLRAFSWAKCARQTHDVYEAVLESRR